MDKVLISLIYFGFALITTVQYKKQILSWPLFFGLGGVLSLIFSPWHLGGYIMGGSFFLSLNLLRFKNIPLAILFKLPILTALALLYWKNDAQVLCFLILLEVLIISGLIWVNRSRERVRLIHFMKAVILLIFGHFFLWKAPQWIGAYYLYAFVTTYFAEDFWKRLR